MDGEYELFKAGDWVTWAFEPGDPEYPYADSNHRAEELKKNGFLVPTYLEDPIEHERKFFEDPPFQVVIVIPAPRKEVRHPQVVGVEMIPRSVKIQLDPKHPNPDTRHFSGLLFKKVNSPAGRTGNLEKVP